MPSFSIDDAFRRFLDNEEVLASATNSNEATTRLRAINVMLHKVLGWDERVVEAEKHCRAKGYADYVFYDGGSISWVLEAKRSGRSFFISESARTPGPHGFELISQESKEADEALRQALGYAAGLGARFIAISNGHQWLLTLTYVHQQQIENRLVFIFDGLEQIKSCFRQFWNCFSPDAIRANKPADALLEARKSPPPAKASTFIPDYPQAANRNSIVAELETVLKVVWEDVKTSETELAFLESCYIRPRRSESGFAFAEQLLKQRLTQDEQIHVESIQGPGINEVLSHANNSERPIIVLGRIGHGKTTFLRYLRQVEAKSILNRYVQLDINFLDRPDSPEAVGKYVFSEVFTQLREKYDIDVTRDNIVRGVLHEELQRFRNTPAAKAYSEGTKEFVIEELKFIQALQEDEHQYLRRVFFHLKHGQKKSVAIFFDNLDRRIDSIQEEAFLRASAIARDWACLVFVCLRPGTFYRSKAFGVLDTVAPRIITIVSPKSKVLIPPRLEFARQFALGKNIKHKQRDRGKGKISLSMPDVARFLGCCAASFRDDKKLSDLFDAVSNGNAREMLLSVFDATTSTHLNTEKIIEKLKVSSYRMPDFEALRALLFKDALFYDPNRSPFVNLFDISHADPAEHFSRYILLLFLLSIPDGHPNYGYVAVEEAVRYLCQIGFSEEHSKHCIRYMFDKNYAEARNGLDEWSAEISEIKITAKGKYHINHLVRTFTYFDAILIDTPILDEQTRVAIITTKDVPSRVENCRLFLGYLQQQCGLIQDASFSKHWQGTTGALATDLDRVLRSAKSNALSSARSARRH